MSGTVRMIISLYLVIKVNLSHIQLILVIKQFSKRLDYSVSLPQGSLNGETEGC